MAIKKSAKPKRKEFDAIDIMSALSDDKIKLDFKFKKRDYRFTDKQKNLIDKILDPKIKVIFIDSVAGTGKSLLAVYCGLTMIKDQSANKMLYMRSVVESNSKGLGFLKGSLEEKMQIWRHVLDAKVEELVESIDIPKILTSGKLEALPINYIRGASWKNMFVCIDEAQNLNYDDYKLIMSRVGDNTKLIICGDSDQCDIKDSGFAKVANMFDDADSKQMGIMTFKFEEEDIVRSELCKFVVSKFKKEKN
jgi:predicted ribonuclease YlaK